MMGEQIMKKDYKISVIIPVYNVETYLKQSIDSILNQTYQNYEVILIDDGSTDDSSQICDLYAKVNDKISVIHTQNQGLSAARNLGTKKAQGDYIFYLDSDDYVKENILERMVCFVEKYDADIVCGNYIYTYPDKTDIAIIEEKEYEIFDNYSAMQELIKGEKIQNFAWGKLIKREIAQICKFPVGKLFEDMYWTHYIIDKAEKIVIDYQSFVYYRQRDNSISYNFKVKNLDQLGGMKDREQFIEKNYNGLLNDYRKRMIKNVMNLAWYSIRYLKGVEQKSAIEKLRKFYEKTDLGQVREEDRKLISLFCKNIMMYKIKVSIEKLKKGGK